MLTHLIASGVVGSAAAVTLTVNIRDAANALRTSLTGLRWSWFDQAAGELQAPTAQGTSESTDANGVLELDLTGTSLVSGQTGTLMLMTGDEADGLAARLTI